MVLGLVGLGEDSAIWALQVTLEWGSFRNNGLQLETSERLSQAPHNICLPCRHLVSVILIWRRESLLLISWDSS